MKKIIIVAGDASGDLYGGTLSKKLKEKFKGLEIYSFGGPFLAKYSLQKENLLSHSVGGLWEVFSSLQNLFKSLKNTLQQIKKIKPDLIILIDFPDFNLALAKKLKRGFPIFYYVSPQVWAWRKKRIGIIKRYVDKMVIIFGFEKEFYKKEEIDALYFGHPLLEIIPALNIPTQKIISFLPGSRKNELKYHLPLIYETKEILKKELPEYSFRIIRPAHFPSQLYKAPPDVEITEHSYARLKESSFILSSSGTATIEITILEVPFLIFYKIHPLSWFILKEIVKTNFVGMPNILANKMIVEEYLQRRANPSRLAKTTIHILKDPQRYTRLKLQLQEIKKFLLPQGAIEGFSSYIGKFLNLY